MTTRCAALMFAACVGCLTSTGYTLGQPSTAGHAESNRAAKAKAAQDAYDKLLAEYRSGKVTGAVHLELLNVWSVRVFLKSIPGEVVASGRFETMRQPWIEHQKRMAALNDLVGDMAK